MPEDKAKTFPLQDYPVQFELISSKSNIPSQNRISFERIEEIFDLQETKQPSKILLKGMYDLNFNRVAVNHVALYRKNSSWRKIVMSVIFNADEWNIRQHKIFFH